MPHNQVLEGVQQRISQRLQSDLNADAENRRAQAEGLHKIIWDPDATDEARERAQQTLEKLYPNSKDLMGRIKQASGKIFSFFKAPPSIQDAAQSKSQETLNQATREDMAGADPNVQATYSGMLPPPPSMQSAHAQQPNRESGAVAMRTASPSSVPMYQAAAQPPAQSQVLPPPPSLLQTGGGVPMRGPNEPARPMDEKIPYDPAIAKQSGTQLPGGVRPGSVVQDIGALLRSKMQRTKQDEIDKEQRVSKTKMEEERVKSERDQQDAIELAKLQHTQIAEREEAARKGQYHEPYTVSGGILYNQQTGKWEQLPADANKPDTSLDINEVAMMAADPTHPKNAIAKEAMRLLTDKEKAERAANSNSLLNQLRELQLAEKTLTTPGQIINAATGNPVNLGVTEAKEIRDYQTLLDQGEMVKGMIDKLGSTGAISGWVLREGIYVPVVQSALTPTQQQAVSEFSRLLNSYVYTVSGKQINEKELPRLGQTLPDLRFDTTANKLVVDNFLRYAASGLNNYMRVNGWKIKEGEAPLNPSGRSDLGNTPGATPNAARPALTPPPSQQGAAGGAVGARGAAQPGGSDTVRVISPKGQPGTIPRANLEAAIKQGYKEVK